MFDCRGEQSDDTWRNIVHRQQAQGLDFRNQLSRRHDTNIARPDGFADIRVAVMSARYHADHPLGRHVIVSSVDAQLSRWVAMFSLILTTGVPSEPLTRARRLMLMRTRFRGSKFTYLVSLPPL